MRSFASLRYTQDDIKTGGKMVKRTYIKQIIRLLDLEIWYAKYKNTK
ncbi:hypothetical protein PL9214290736 [Planktothrix tepida PCC 9214]|uniref:Uncharacterized protein n=1 Tax=Planktothrix tepida PCC 9214 TaxID=671072 RepID=A0A1J1LHT8_9CYAN|nr:hypothetical protein PL9214290736 [Planktothrix tepida PCC 9214]